jgi:ribose 5-phosphate isomerase A
MGDRDYLKEMAARRAVEFVRDRMIIGLGTGSTAALAVKALAEKVRQGCRILGIATSRETEALARQLGIPLTTLEEHPEVDLTIDGADEVDPNGNLIKGLGGALLREKIVASATKQEIIAVDGSKLVGRLGTKALIPVEVIPFGWTRCQKALQALGATAELRRCGSSPFVTDNGNYILDSSFGPLEDPYRLAGAVKAIVGVVEHGLFLDLADIVIVGNEDGVLVHAVERRKRSATAGPA